jgi:hypothetical protein
VGAHKQPVGRQAVQRREGDDSVLISWAMIGDAVIELEGNVLDVARSHRARSAPPGLPDRRRRSRGCIGWATLLLATAINE